MAKRRKQSPAMIIGLTLILASIVGFVFSLMAVNRVGQVRKEMTELKNSYERQIEKMEADFQTKLASIERLLGGGGTLEKYIVAKNFLSNTSVDLDAILTEMQHQSDRPYFRVFVTGTKEVWIGMKKSSSDSAYYFQKNFKPGLSQEKFYYLKNPEIETKYTIMLNKDAYIRTGVPESVYLIFFGFDSGKLSRMPGVEIANLKDAFNLYIPGG
ncbi:MAG TPA: hypothetical protein PLA66_07730 [Mesotoga sp.]|nr:hypothetical protein [Thermotogota bacterium]HPI17024.1 hypothetical protein [Mesotoga sp.]HPX22726.1 hypothetical protein [Mesotoga sp.]